MRVALYARVSTQEQAIHGLSIEAQTAALEEWAKPYTVVDLYKDEGISAQKPITKRPDLQRLLSDVEAGKIDLVVFTKLDRWTRNVREYYKAQDILDAHGVAWRALQEDYETQTAAGKFKVNVMLAVAQQEAERTGERVKAVMDRKRAKGEALTGSVPFGVKIGGKKYVPNEDAEKVQTLFREYINRRSVRDTIRVSEALIGRTFTDHGMRALLENDTYVKAGVISKDTFQKAQEIRAQRSQRHSRSERIYLFSGLVHCSCGYRMTAHTTTTKGKEYVYYFCKNWRNNFQCENTRQYNEKHIEQFLLLNLLDGVEMYNRSIRGKQKKVDTAAIKRKMDKLTDLYMSDLIDRERYEKEYRACQSLLNSQQAPQRIDKDEVVSMLGEYQKLDRTHQKAFWGRVLKRIDIDKDGNIFFTPSFL